ncbi:hypothetical protein PIB30_029899 [Stylosanthes scabra]|uniref:Uncharacterized protein n=1 Tax=Stylosanthes scabra TaxID=79078 RepID=A0ABU6RBQ8_9FABA|nr:hypothetical protein [Stylosanthes scabra]
MRLRALGRAPHEAQNQALWAPQSGRAPVHRDRAPVQMARKGKEIAATSTPSRSRTTKNSNQGREDAFPAERFDSKIHYDRWKAMEHRGYTHERIIHLPDEEPDFWRARLEGLSCQETVFLLRRRILFTENDIRRYLNIHIDLSGPGENDAFKEATVMHVHPSWF